MIRTALTTALTAAGCTRIIYESAQLANIAADAALVADVVGIILEPDGMTLELRGNGVHERYAPTIVEVVKQVIPEDTAANNEATLQAMLTVCKLFITSVVRTGAFQKVPNVPLTKVTERRYDANVLGWSMTLDLQPITNALNC